MKEKVTVAMSVDEILAKKSSELAKSIGISRSQLLNVLMEKFLHAHEKAALIEEPVDYVKETEQYRSCYCPTQMGVMMTFCFDIDWVQK